MATARLADRQIRAAQQAALRLDVRGPVSEALGKTGIVVPAAKPAPTDEPLAAADRQPTTAPPRTVGRGLRPTVKPIAPAPWPTRRTVPSEPDPLSGLTADERRVHRILLDQLALANAQSQNGVGGLTYVEKKKLATLDLAFINAELAKMSEREVRTAETGRVGILVTLFLAPLALGIALVAGAGVEAVLIALGVLVAASGALLGMSAQTNPSAPRRQIYQALRELAVLLDEDAASEAILQADLLIDQLAGADVPAAPTARRRARS